MASLPPKGAEDALYLLDLSGWTHRAWHALKRSGEHLRTGPNGEPCGVTGKVVGWLIDLIRDRAPAYLAVALDTHGSTWRHRLYDGYQADRDPPDPGLVAQEARCVAILKAHRIPCLRVEDFDGDDMLAAATARARRCGLRVVVISSDKDLLPLTADPGVIVWDHRTGETIGAAEVEANVKRFGGVGPGQLADLLALMGDSCDGIPGVEGIGPKKGAELLKAFGGLEEVLRRAPLESKPGKVRDALVTQAEMARLSAKLVALRADAPIAFDPTELRVGWDEADAASLRAMYRELGFGWAGVVEPMPKGLVPPAVLASAAAVEREFFDVGAGAVDVSPAEEKPATVIVEWSSDAKAAALELVAPRREPEPPEALLVVAGPRCPAVQLGFQGFGW